MINLSFELLKVGYCRHPEFIVLQGGRWTACEFPAICALIKHPTLGYILYDTGYSSHFFTETRPFPYRFYAWTTPVHLQPHETLLAQLQQRGIAASEIKIILISHFHADHIAGLRDFPHARFICLHKGFSAIHSKTGFSALLNAYIPNLLPHNFQQRVQFVEQSQLINLPTSFFPFQTGYDIFGDQSLIGLELAGHAQGQMGIILQNKHLYFLVADACWSRQAYQDYRLPHWLAFTIFSEKKAYKNTLYQLHTLSKMNSAVTIIPSHCLQTFSTLQAKFNTQFT